MNEWVERKVLGDILERILSVNKKPIQEQLTDNHG
jgi:hypothetical protein